MGLRGRGSECLRIAVLAVVEMGGVVDIHDGSTIIVDVGEPRLEGVRLAQEVDGTMGRVTVQAS